MAKLQDDPKVKELLDKAAAKAKKEAVAASVTAAKEAVAFHAAEHEARGDRTTMKHITALGKTLAAKLKATPSAGAEGH
jgi:hypothetical protein